METSTADEFQRALMVSFGEGTPNDLQIPTTFNWVVWCSADPGRRYAMAAAVVEFSIRDSVSNTLRWSETALELLARAAAPEDVLLRFMDRFEPMAWSGSRARIIENNLDLIVQLKDRVPSNVYDLALRERDRLRWEVSQWRALEEAEERGEHPSFE